MAQHTCGDSTTRLCTADECDRPLRAKGYCAYHYRKLVNPAKKQAAVECPTCGTVTMKRDPDRRFCSLICRDVWRIETGNNPAPPRQKRVSRLPVGHPVRALIKAEAQRAARGPLRAAVEDEDWPGILSAVKAHVVEVDGCWLWGRQVDRKSYARVFVGKREHRVHRLTRAAADRAWVPSHLPVHHTCAEAMCVNPDHLQVVTPEQNTAEMMERHYYQRRIAELEAALSALDATHPLLARISPAA